MTGTGADAIPGVVAAIDDGIGTLQLGALVQVVLGGMEVANLAIGEARAGVPMTTDRMIIWWSMTKATIAVAIAQLWERGEVDLDDRVAAHVPEFGVKGKEALTIRHLLTHTGGFRGGDRVKGEWDALVAGICDVPLEPGWVPGETAGYHLQGSMTILGEVVRRADGRAFEQYIRDEVFLPLGMPDCWVGVPLEEQPRYAGRIGTMHDMKPEVPRQRDELDTPDQLRRCWPGGGGRGPLSQLTRLYQALLGRGELDGVRILSPQTVEAITSPHRVGIYDKTFGVVNQWGLGLQVDSYLMGPHCSRRSFGHGGAYSSNSFADPEHGLAVAVQCNGMPTVVPHQQRFHRIFKALYEDLGLAPAGSPGREKEPGKYA